MRKPGLGGIEWVCDNLALLWEVNVIVSCERLLRANIYFILIVCLVNPAFDDFVRET